jgi:hypothetical protein
MKRFLKIALGLGLVLVFCGTLSPAYAQTPGPGLFVTNLRLNPSQPAFNQTLSFYATFSNTTSTPQNFTWKVYIFRADTPTKYIEETTAQMTGFAVGTLEYPALGSFHYGPTGYSCEFFFAQVGWLDANNNVTYLTSPDGTVYQKGFQICDASLIPTPAPVTPAPTSVPPTPGPGLFVSALGLSPAQPAFNQDITFNATFLNNSSTVQTFNWKVYIYRADTPDRSNNETTALLTSFPVGTGQYTSLGSFHYGPTGYTCEYFFARVGWLDANNQINFLLAPDGTVFQKGFTICDASVIPTLIPATPAPTAVPPTPGPGLFVTNVRLQPFDTPQHNMPTTFFVTFQNTSNTGMTFPWRVLIYRADTPNKSNTDTAIQLTSFPVGTQEVQALNTFSYGATGYTCDYFFARVAWLDANNQVNFFLAPGGTVYQKGFQICN